MIELYTQSKERKKLVKLTQNLANKQVQQHNRKFGTREEPKYDKKDIHSSTRPKQTSETIRQKIGQQTSEANK